MVHVLGSKEVWGVGCSPVKDVEASDEQEGPWDSLCLTGMGSSRRLQAGLA